MAVKKRKPGRPPLSEAEKARRLLEKEKLKLEKQLEREKLKAEKEAQKEEQAKRKAAMIERNNSPDAMGQWKPGGGRAKGTVIKSKINPYKGVDKLEELGFDPLEKHIQSYRELTELMEETKDDGTPVVKVGSMAHAQMLNTRKSILDTLMKYGYRPVPEKQEIEHSQKAPVMIKLTHK